MGLSSYRTPRRVWVTSAIVAALLHAAAVYGAIAVWQNRRSAVTPGPISVIALPVGTETALAPTPPPTAGAPADTQPALSESNTTQRPFEPVAPTTVSPEPRPVARPTQPALPPVTPNAPAPSPAPVTPVAPNAPSTGSEVVPPVQPESPGEVEPPAPVPPSGGSPTEESGIATSWRRELVPGGGSAIHPVKPDLPTTWPASVTALVTNAGCASGISPGTSITVTLWPIIEADGQISEFLPRDAENMGTEALVSCILALRAQMPPLTPAQDGGAAIASDEILIIVEIRSTS